MDAIAAQIGAGVVLLAAAASLGYSVIGFFKGREWFHGVEGSDNPKKQERDLGEEAPDDKDDRKKNEEADALI
jgi:hypothetical protein